MTFLGVCLMTENVLELTEFYKMVLQATADGDDIHMEILTHGASLAIYNNGDVKDSKNENIILGFEVANVDAEYERLKTLKVKITMIPTIYPWGRRAMQIADPDGNLINLSCKNSLSQ